MDLFLIITISVSCVVFVCIIFLIICYCRLEKRNQADFERDNYDDFNDQRSGGSGKLLDADGGGTSTSSNVQTVEEFQLKKNKSRKSSTSKTKGSTSSPKRESKN